MDTGIRILYYLIFTAEMLILDNILFHNRTKDKRRYLLTGILYIAITILTITYNDYYLPPVGTFLYVMVFMLLLEDNWWKRLLHCLITFLIAGSVETVLAVIMHRIPMYSQYIWPYEYPDILMEGIAVLLSVTFVHRKGLKQFLECCRVLKWYQLAAIATIVLGGTALLVYGNIVAHMDFWDGRGMTIQWIILVFVVIIFFGIIWFVYGSYDKDYYQKQNALKVELLDAQKNYYDSMYQNDLETRKFKHDIKAQLGCLNQLLEEGKTQEAMEHLRTIEQNYMQLKENKIKTGLYVLDLVVNQAYARAKEKGIVLSLKGRIETEKVFNTYDLCSIFSNALNNAIEACEKFEKQDRKIEIRLLEHSDTLRISISNPATEEMYRAILNNNTTKEDKRNHGLGIANIRMAAERNHGQVEYRYQEGIITLEIYL